MDGSKLPLSMWFWAVYLVATHSNGNFAAPVSYQDYRIET